MVSLSFTSRDLLKKIGNQKTSRELRNKETIFRQGDAADAMFYIQDGNVKLTVASRRGKRAVLALWKAIRVKVRGAEGEPANSRGHGRSTRSRESLHEWTQKNGIPPLQRGLAGTPGATRLHPPGVSEM
jgi:CRP-like cAMP-binding protein